MMGFAGVAGWREPTSGMVGGPGGMSMVAAADGGEDGMGDLDSCKMQIMYNQGRGCRS